MFNMIKKLDKFLKEVSKLSANEQKILTNLNYFQVEVLKQINENKIKKISKLISLSREHSRAQKYRYINELIKLKICQINKHGLLEIKKNH
jgi:hypothetical protein